MASKCGYVIVLASYGSAGEFVWSGRTVQGMPEAEAFRSNQLEMKANADFPQEARGRGMVQAGDLTNGLPVDYPPDQNDRECVRW